MTTNDPSRPKETQPDFREVDSPQKRKPARKRYWWSGMTGAEILAGAQATLRADKEDQ